MDIFRIEGPVKLSGSVDTNGSKNASLPIMAASILAPGRTVLKRVPRLSDISVSTELLGQLGCRVGREENGDLFPKIGSVSEINNKQADTSHHAQEIPD